MLSLLNRPSLVLNKCWQAIHFVSAKNAIVKTASRRSLIIDPRNYNEYSLTDWIGRQIPSNAVCIKHSYDRLIEVPEIIRLISYDKYPKRKVIFCRRALWKRDCQRCQYCGKKPRYDEITIDHVIPRSRGGQSCFENCVLACLKCNLKKRNRTPEESGMALMKKPSVPIWCPTYSVCKKNIPISCLKFLKQRELNDYYWSTEIQT